MRYMNGPIGKFGWKQQKYQDTSLQGVVHPGEEVKLMNNILKITPPINPRVFALRERKRFGETYR